MKGFTKILTSWDWYNLGIQNYIWGWEVDLVKDGVTLYTMQLVPHRVLWITCLGTLTSFDIFNRVLNWYLFLVCDYNFCILCQLNSTQYQSSLLIYCMILCTTNRSTIVLLVYCTSSQICRVPLCSLSYRHIGVSLSTAASYYQPTPWLWCVIMGQHHKLFLNYGFSSAPLNP